MGLRRPTSQDVLALGRRLRLGISPEEAQEFASLVDEALAAHDWIAEEMRAPRETTLHGWRPSAEENPLGAWAWRTEISEATTGPLAGKAVAVKDNICVAGAPATNGTVLLEGFVADEHATVVRRVLEAGGTIAGKAVCESLCYSGGSHTSDSGPVRNPYDSSRSSGGSSSGCAALLASGEVDLALGGDQGGSIRGPCSWSGVYGLKPTYGLVPYTGAFPLEMTLDHLGPMARSSADVALLLDVLAGADGLDPRQTSTPRRADESYLDGLANDLEPLRVGTLGEGFGWESASQPDVDDAVRDAADGLRVLGATVGELSVPEHRTGGRVALGIAAEGSTALLIHGSGAGTNWKGKYPTKMAEAFAAGLRRRGERLAPMVKLQALVGQWLIETYGGVRYAEAQDMGRRLARAYDDALTAVDLLVLPTTPMKATLLPDPGISATESVHVAHQMGANTSPFNVTGHPAMSVPCAISDGLPVGMMLVGRRGEDGTVLRMAAAFEREVFRPPPLPPTQERRSAQRIQ